jgi:ComF family protein
MPFLQNIFDSFCSYALPTSCIVCERFQGLRICETCKQVLINEALCHYECCYQCGIPLITPELIDHHCQTCKIRKPHFDQTYCLDRYEGGLQNALHQLKYQKRIAFAQGLADIWNAVMSEQLDDIEADCLFPVPLSIEKLSLRGFNQSWEIAKRMRCKSKIQKLPNILRRHHYQEPQAGSSLLSRHSKIRGAFYLEKNALTLLHNKRVIIVDDVMTSGATLDEIARVLKDNGAIRVINWVLLRTSKSP